MAVYERTANVVTFFFPVFTVLDLILMLVVD